MVRIGYVNGYYNVVIIWRGREPSTGRPVPPQAGAVTHEPAPAFRRASLVELIADAHGPGAIEIG